MLIAKDHERDRVASTVTRQVLMAVVKRRYRTSGLRGPVGEGDENETPLPNITTFSASFRALRPSVVSGLAD
jgi:hypothetical protein